MIGNQDQVRVNKFVVIRTGAYNPMMHRPYAMNLNDARLIQDVGNRLDPRLPYTPNLFAGLSTQLVAPTAAPTANVGIVNGWETPRFRFIMELEWITSIGARLVQILTGYTEHGEISFNGLLDPRMQFFVNNSFNFRLDIQQTPSGPIRRLVPTSGGQILIDNNYRGMYDNTVSLARPSDVIAVKALSPFLDKTSSSGMHIDGSTVTNSAKLSRRSHSNPATYMSTILDGHRQSHVELRTYGQSDEDIDSQAINQVSDKDSSHDRFLNAIKNINQATIVGNYFTLTDLTTIDPNHPNATHIISNPSTTQSTMMGSGTQSEHWGGAGRHTQVASILINALPGIMTDNALAKVSFTANNFDGGGRFVFAWSNVRGFINDVDLSGFIINMQNRIETELLVDLSYNNEMKFGISGHCDILGDTSLEITIGGEMYQFTAPTFCDALYSPVMVGGIDGVRTIAHGFDQLMGISYDRLDGTGSGFSGDVNTLAPINNQSGSLDFL